MILVVAADGNKERLLVLESQAEVHTQKEARTNPPLGEGVISHHNDLILGQALFVFVVDIDHMQCPARHPGCRTPTRVLMGLLVTPSVEISI